MSQRYVSTIICLFIPFLVIVGLNIDSLSNIAPMTASVLTGLTSSLKGLLQPLLNFGKFLLIVFGAIGVGLSIKILQSAYAPQKPFLTWLCGFISAGFALYFMISVHTGWAYGAVFILISAHHTRAFLRKINLDSSLSDEDAKHIKRNMIPMLASYALTTCSLSLIILFFQEISDYQGRYDDISYTLNMSDQDIALMDEKFFAIKYKDKSIDKYHFLDRDDPLLSMNVSGSAPFPLKEDIYVIFQRLPEKDNFGCVISLNPDPKIRIYSGTLSQFVKTNLSLERLCVIKMKEYIGISDD